MDKKFLLLGGVALVAAAFSASMASAQAQQNQQTPRGWSYEIKDGKRVPKGNRVTNADGSWRETVKQGNCVTIKERSPQGEYKETRQCNPN
jgi:outer membrane usher protein FimD/PapC